MTKLTKTQKTELEQIKSKFQAIRPKSPNMSVDENEDGEYEAKMGEGNGELDLYQLMDALAIYDPDMIGGFVEQLANSVSKSKEIHNPSLSFAVGFVKAIEPRNEIEAAVAAQMAATHICALDSSRRYLAAQTLAGKDSAERAMNKFTRTFTAQMEALKKYRAKAQQTVRVERVTVNDGGQAIVGSVETSGGSNAKR